MMSLTALTVLVYIALTVTVGAPVLLLALLIRDFKKGELW